MPTAVTATRGRPPIVSDGGARLREAGDRGDDGGQGRPPPGERLPGGRHLAHGHRAVGEAQPRPSRSRCGTRRSASSATSARSCARTPPSGPRSTRPRPWRAPPPPSSPTTSAPTELRARSTRIQVAPRTARAARLCVQVCPAKDKTNPRHKAIDMAPQRPAARGGAGELRLLPRPARAGPRGSRRVDLKTSQFLQPLFEYSGACAGCGETPYIKLLTQLFGDRALIANATGCSSIYGGNLPTTPYTTNARRPRARLGQLALRGQRGVRPGLPPGPGRPARARPSACCSAWRRDRRAVVVEHPGGGAGRPRPASRASASGCASSSRGSPPWRDRTRARLETVADYLVRKSVWLVGGDGWAYDIGFGGLDHVLGQRPRRQRAGARHRGLLEHRRPAVEGHAAGRLGQVRGGGQGDPQEGPRPAGHELRPRLRGPHRLRREDGADRSRPSRRPRPIPARR